MALTIGESHAVFDLLGFLLAAPGPTGPVPSGRALEAAVLLAGKARKTLAAGLPEEKVRDLWPLLEQHLSTDPQPDEAACHLCGCTSEAAGEAVHVELAAPRALAEQWVDGIRSLIGDHARVRLVAGLPFGPRYQVVISRIDADTDDLGEDL